MSGWRKWLADRPPRDKPGDSWLTKQWKSAVRMSEWQGPLTLLVVILLICLTR
ncbi:MAG: hypothetical protein ACRDPG_05040 [Nocardioidaceae bacterium]